eukprot:364073-Chlamydomonas_euryale.AAC.4
MPPTVPCAPRLRGTAHSQCQSAESRRAAAAALWQTAPASAGWPTPTERPAVQPRPPVPASRGVAWRDCRVGWQKGSEHRSIACYLAIDSAARWQGLGRSLRSVKTRLGGDSQRGVAPAHPRGASHCVARCWVCNSTSARSIPLRCRVLGVQQHIREEHPTALQGVGCAIAHPRGASHCVARCWECNSTSARSIPLRCKVWLGLGFGSASDT